MKSPCGRYTDRRVDCERHQPGRAAGDAKEHHRERARRDLVADYGVRRLAVVDAVSASWPQQGERHRRSVDGPVEPPDEGRPHHGHFVAVGQDDARCFASFLQQVRELRDDQAHSEQFRLRESEPASIAMSVSAQDTAIMFSPNSPRPPRGTTSRRGDRMRRSQLVGHQGPYAPHQRPSRVAANLGWVSARHSRQSPCRDPPTPHGRVSTETPLPTRSALGERTAGAGLVGACQAAGIARITGKTKTVVTRELYHRSRREAPSDRKPSQLRKMQRLGSAPGIQAGRPDHSSGSCFGCAPAASARRDGFSPLGEQRANHEIEQSRSFTATGDGRKTRRMTCDHTSGGGRARRGAASAPTARRRRSAPGLTARRTLLNLPAMQFVGDSRCT